MTNPSCINYRSLCTNVILVSRKRGNAFTDATSISWIPSVHPMSSLSWLIVSVFEFLLFILVARKAKYQFWCKRRSKEVLKARDIMKVIAKDSTNYFIMWVYTVKKVEVENLYLELCFYKSIFYKCYRNHDFLCFRSWYLSKRLHSGLCLLNPSSSCIFSPDYSLGRSRELPQHISDYSHSSDDHIGTQNVDQYTFGNV